MASFHRPGYQATHDKKSGQKEFSGSKACDPIIVLDDDETDAAEILHIDLENDNEVPAKGTYTAQTKQAMPAPQGLESTSVAKKSSYCNNILGPDHAKQSERVTFPLFRTLTKHDMQGPSLRSESESTPALGFKAWYEARDSGRMGDNVFKMRQKATSQIPSITLNNEKHLNNTARKDRDAPQFEMNVLSSRRKRTMGELGYDELISPAHIESPSEKLIRMARKRQLHQEKYDAVLRNKDAGDTPSATEVDNRYGHEDDEMTRENVEMPLFPIVRTSHDGQDSAARLSDERSGPSVARQPSPVGSYLLSEGQSGHVATEPRDDHGDGHTDATKMRSNQISAQEHGNSTNGAHSNDSVSRKLEHRKLKRCGPTAVCGVFSAGTKPAVKKSHRGPYHCPRCDSQFTTWHTVNYHFEGCVAKYGNPKSLRWNDHPSLEGVAKRAFRSSKDPRTMGAQASAASKESAQSNVPIVGQTTLGRTTLGSVCVRSGNTPRHVPADTQIGIAAPIAQMTAPLLSSDTQESDPSALPANQPANKGYVTRKPDPPAPLSEHHATAGKGLSLETLKRFQETGSWDRRMMVDQGEDDAEEEEEETELPEVAYRYYVQKREWLETEEDAMEASMGPFHTLNEANAVAKAEVQSPQMDEYEGLQSMGWSYYYEQDENGLQKHMATVLGIHIETAVFRGKPHISGLLPEI